MEIMETGDKNHDMSEHHAYVLKRKLRKINAKGVELFRNGSVHEFYSFKALITFGTSGYFCGRKKKSLYDWVL